MRIYYSREFLKSFEKLPKETQKIHQTKEKIFSSEPLHSILRMPKIRELDCWAFLVTYKVRVIFSFKNGNAFLINIGDHSLYRDR